MDRQIKEMSKKRTWKRIFKRGMALLCAVVMLFTMNTLKRNADTLERIAMCGYAEHVHSESCFVGDVLSCGMTEHIHTDACYQESPVSIGMDDLSLDMDAPMIDGDAGDLDLSLSLDGFDLVTEDVAAQQPVANVGETKAFSLGTGAMVSAIIEAVELNVSLDAIVEVGAVENDEAHSGLVAIDKVEGDYRVTARRDFDEAGLALITADDILVVQLRNGVAPVEPAAGEAPATDDQRIDDLIQPEVGSQAVESPAEDVQPAVEDTAPAEDVQPGIAEIAPSEDGEPAVEEIAPAEGAEPVVEEIAPAEGGEPAVEDIALTEEEQLAIEDIAPAEGEAPAIEDTAPAEDEQPAVEDTASAEDGEPAVEDTAPTEADADAPAGDEAVTEAEEHAEASGENEQEISADISSEGDATPAAGDEQAWGDLADLGDEASADQQPGEAEVTDDGESDEAKAIDEAQPAIDGEAELGEEQPAEYGEEQFDEEQPAMDGEAEFGEEQPAIDGEAEFGEEQPAIDGEAELGEEQPAIDGEEQSDEEQPAMDGEAELGEEQPAEDGAEESDEEQPAIDGEAELGEEQPAIDGEEQSDEEQPAIDGEAELDEEQPAEDGAEESDEEQPAIDGEAELGEEQPAIDGEEQSDEEQPAIDGEAELDEEQPAEDGEGQSDEEQPAIDGEAELDEEQPAEDGEEASDEEQPAIDGEEESTEEESTEEEATEEETAKEEATEEESTEEENPEEETAEEESTEEEPTEEETTEGEATEEESTEEEATEEESTEEESTEEEATEEETAKEEATEEEATEEEATEEEATEEESTEEESTEEEATEEESTEEEATEEENPEEETAEEEAAEEETEAEDAGEQPVFEATVDMAEAGEYPLSLNALVAQIAPASNEAAEPVEAPAEDSEGTGGEADEGTEKDAGEDAGETPEPAWTVEYDRELLEITEDGQDCLITPVQSFESTLIVADNGSRYALTLVNCALEQAATEEAEEPEAEQPAMLAQEFEGSTEYVRVTVSAPEGAFPEGTTMALSDVEDEKTLTDIEDTVTEGFVKVERVHAVDITFFDAEGNEIEPLVPISVVMAVAEIAQEEAAVVVHVDDDGAPQVVESRSEAPEGETGLKVEMPAAEASEATEESDQAETSEAADEPAEPQANAGADGAAVGFEADSFSVYAVVVTRTLEAKYIDASGETWSVSVGYGPEALIPDDARLAVSEVTDDSYLAEAEAALEGGKRVTLARFFDISILDADGAEVQPAVPVTVNIALDNSQTRQAEAAEHVIDSGEPEVCAVHFDEEKTDIVTAAEKEEAVVFDAVSFSVWGVMYTVDFYYGDYEYHMPGEESITLSALFGVLSIEADAAQAEAVVFTNPELLEVARLEDGSDWLMTSLAPFDTEEKLTVTMADGTVYEIRVTDAQYDYRALVNDGGLGHFESGKLFSWSSDHTYYTTGIYGVVYYPQGTETIVEFKRPLNSTVNYSFDAVPNNDSSRYACCIKYKNGEYSNITKKNSNNIDFNAWGEIGDDTLLIAYFAQNNAKVIVFNNWDTNKGSIAVSPYNNNTGNFKDGYRKPYTANGALINEGSYLYSTDNITLTATPNGEYFFKGWYDDDGALYSVNPVLKTNEVNQDIVLTPVFEKNYKYNVIANTVKHKGEDQNHNLYDITINPALFSIPDVPASWFSDNVNPYATPKIEWTNLDTERLDSMDLCSFRFPVKTQSNNSNYVFAYWLKDDGTAPVVDGTDLAGFLNSDGSMRDKYNGLDRNTTFVAFYKPKNDYIVRINKPAEGGQFEHKAVWNWIDGTRKVQYDNKTLFEYYFAGDHPLINAIPADGWYFDGWYNNGTKKISSDQFFNVYEYVYGNYYNNTQFPDCHLSTELTPHLSDLNLTPVFKKKVDYFNVWFDGSDGIGGGEVGNDTFYTRINGKGNVEGSTSVYMKVAKQDYDSNNPKSGSATITLPTTAVNPQSQSSNKFELQGWYEIYTGQYYNKGETVTITGDAVFYADWMPSNYNIGQNSNVAPTVDTSSFITTRMYDYNNLFNMDSIYLDLGRSSASMPTDAQSLGYVTQKGDLPWTQYNKEYWYMNGESDDFIFMSTVSGKGRSLNPYGRDEKNQNRETSTNGKYYTAIPTQGLLTSSLRDKLFDEKSETLGKNYAGTANHLYQYDASTGYYYYDSDKNAASYNANDRRFYVYNYTNKTNKSNGGDNTDFLPFNYGNSEFSEMYGAPNYWFGMSSQIDFFLPNPTGYRDDNGVTGNRSVLGDEMVYKFAGDDDVWVFVDDQPVLDMGGVHGKIYGEINFSQGTWTIAYNGAEKKVDNRNIMSYSGGSTLSGTLNDIGEGDHTLTLYYLERGASQSNCAIYFNLAPRYQLRFEKKDSLKKNGLQGARFGVYADAACTVAADLKHWNETTNEFTSGGDGIVHAQGLAAGRTYYIKELQAPTNYPDMSGFVMALTLDSRGNPTITVPAGAANMVDTSGLEPVSGKDRTYKLSMVDGQPDMIYLPILNNSETSITATKTWSLLDGKAYRTFEMDGKLITEYENSAASVKVQLQRYYEDNNSGETVGNHTVQLVTQYFGSDSGTYNRDDASLSHYQTETRTVGDGGTVSFSLSTDTGAGIYSVVSTGGSLSSHITSTTEGKPFKVNGSSANRPNAGNYTVSGIRNDAVIYITIIGAANSETDLMGKVHMTNVQTTDGSGTARRISRDTGFNDDPKDKNDEDIPDNGVVTLSKDNGWTHTWDNLATDDGQGHRVYYYVVEKDTVTPQSAALGGASAFIRTTSSDGLSGGIITVHNTLRAVKVKLRKRDAAYADGNRVDLKGAEFAIYTEEEYQKYKNNQSASAMMPNGGLINSGEMGQYDGTKLVTDDLGRFYTGFLPNGEYYIVETKAPDGYAPLEHDIRIVISEKGLSYDLNDGNGSKDRKPDSEGIYNLFIDNTMDRGSIKIKKLWHSGSDYGLTSAYAHDDGANDFDLDEENHLYSNSDNGATAVLLSLGCVVNGAVDAGAVSDVYDNPTSHGLTADQIVNRGGTRYIKLAKGQSGWPTLTVSNLPLKHYADVTYTADDGQTATHKAPVDGWYFIEEYGYVDASGNEILVANKTNEWKVSYGYANGATNGSGKTENVAGTSHNLIKAKKTDPDTLTVTNGFFGRLSFNKRDGFGQPVEGATFKLVPNAAGANNFVTSGNADLVLTSNASGVVAIPTLPMGTYWLQEQSAPEGYRLVQDWYRVEIGYPSSAMYLGNGNEEVTVIDNPPIGALKLTKTVQVGGTAPTVANGAKTNGTYTFTISGLGGMDTEGVSRTVSITFANGRATQYQIDSEEAVPIPETEATDNSWTVTVPDLVPGTYTVAETLPQNGMTLKSVTAGVKKEGELAFVTVVAGDTAAEQGTALATFINNYGKADVKIVKIDENTRSEDEPQRLSGAQFTLIKGDVDVDANTNTQQISYKAIYPDTAGGVKQTDNQGELTFENLPDGCYRLQETRVPDGYVLTSDPYIYFTITDGGLSWTDSEGKPFTDEEEPDGEEHNKVTCDLANATFTVGNEPGARLPSTGGHGTWPYTLGGTLLILCAIAMAMVKRRRQENP